MSVKVVIFDLDGTIVDSMHIYAEKAGELIEKYYGISREEAKRLYLKTSGLPFLEQLNVLFPDKKELNKEVSEEFENWKKEVIKELEVSEEAKEVIKELKKRGIITAVSSNNLKEYVEDMIRRSRAELDYILAWDGKDFKKGEPHISFLEKETRIPRKHFLMVGDSLNDLKLAKSSNIKFIALLTEFKEEDFKSIDSKVKTVKRLKEILNYIN